MKDAGGCTPIETRAGRFFSWLTGRPWTVIALSAALMAVAGAYAPSVRKDPRNTVYINPKHPAKLATLYLEEAFNIDPDRSMILLVRRRAEGGIFTPHTLALVDWLNDELSHVPGVDPDEITSLVTENRIVAGEDDLIVRPFLDEVPDDDVGAEAVRRDVMAFDLYVDTLVSQDGTATVIPIQLLEDASAEAAYRSILELIDRAPNDASEDIFVAGLAAYTVVSGEYIESDSRRLNPIAGLVILGMLAVAYRTVRGVLIPCLAVVAALLACVGAMAASDVPFYTITSSLTVILIAIGVCDGIHIMGQYYTEAAVHRRAGGRELAVRTMAAMWRPVVITSVTSMAGFLALSLATSMPPMITYGIFASVGVTAALFASLVTTPAILSLLPRRTSPMFRGESGERASDGFARALGVLGAGVCARPRLVLGCATVALVVGAVGASQVVRDNEFREFLNPEARLFKADLAISETLGGLQNLHVIVRSADEGGLLELQHLEKISALQAFVNSLPHVIKSRSFVDYTKQMNRAMNEDDPDFHRVPDSSELAGQYLFLYGARAGPTALEKVVDYGYREANLTITFDRARWSDSRQTVWALREYMEGWKPDSLEVLLAGNFFQGFALDHDTARGQVIGVALVFIAVLATAAMMFRSVMAGAMTIVPVIGAILMVYATMGYADIWLNFSTSMTSAIAVGIAVDFAVHTVDRMRGLVRREALSGETVFEIFPSTGRALLFNLLAVMCGFGVLVASEVPPLREFGLLVIVCVASAFAASLTVLPAALLLFGARVVGAAPSAGGGAPPEAELRAGGSTA